MRTEEKTNVQNSVGRVIFVMLALLIQVVWLYSLFSSLNEYSTLISLLCSIAALILVPRCRRGL